MTAYIIRRLLFMVPTLFGVMLVSFVVVQFAPGGPVERVIAQLSGSDTGATSRISGSTAGDLGARGQPGGAAMDGVTSKYRGAQGLDPEFIKSLEKQFGFDKPAYERFFIMLSNYLRFDFGKSYFRDTTVLQLIKEKLPVSISLGIWLTLLTYLISIPLGVRKAVKDGSQFDVWTSGAIIIGYAIPGLLVAALARRQDPRLFLASCVADRLHGAVRLRHNDVAHQEFVSRRDPQAIRAHCARQRLRRASGALRARVPQRHADRDRRLPRRLRARVLCRLAADRDHLLARRHRPARLRERA